MTDLQPNIGPQTGGKRIQRQFPDKSRSLDVALLGVALGSGNRGIGALFSGIVAAANNSLTGTQIWMVDYGRKSIEFRPKYRGSNIPIDTILLRFSKKPWQPNHILRLMAAAVWLRLWKNTSYRQRCISRNPWLNSLDQQNVYLAIAGGDSFSDIYGLYRLFYVSLPQILALMLGKPLVLLPQTYGPFKTWIARWMVRYILKRANLIYSRDQEGLKVVADLLGRNDPRVRFAYDMGFALEPLPPAREIQERLETIRRRGRLIGFNISGLLHMGGYSRKNMFGLKSDYPSLVRAILDFLIQDQQYEVLLVPHVFGDREDSESDVPACKRIMAECANKYGGHLHYLEGDFDQHEIKHIIGQCDFFLGSRMHACIAALSQCVPAVGLAYSRKFAGVLESVGVGSLVVDLCAADEQQVLTAIGNALRDKARLRHELEQRMPSVKASVLNLFASEEFEQILK